MNPVHLMLLFFIKLLSSKYTSLAQYYHFLDNKRGIPVKTLRYLEKSGLKVRKLCVDVKYLESCVELELCPPSLKVTDRKIAESSNANRYHLASLRERLQVVKKELDEANRTYRARLHDVCNSLSLTEQCCLNSLLTTYYDKQLARINQRHKKKMFNLWRVAGKKSPDCIVNISNKELTVHERNALQFGLKHNVLPRSFEGEQIKMNVERLMNDVTWKTNQTEVDFSTREEIKKTYYAFENSCKHLFWTRKNLALHRTLKQLGHNEAIRICSFDKGVGVVVMNSCDYYDKLDAIVGDGTKFEKVSIPEQEDKHPTIIKENSIRYYIDRYITGLDKQSRKRLLPTGSSPGKLYGLCKVHKDNYPLRPVISMLNTPEYELAKYLDGFIKPNIPATYMLNSTNDFIDKLNAYPLKGHEKMVSFDVVSLFTNVPLIETIDIIIQRLYSNTAVVTPDIPKKIFRKMLLLCTQGMFLYKDVLYRQLDGVAMGSPLGPSIANMFMAHRECELLEHTDTPVFYPNLYLRYIDDCFALFDNQSSIDRFLLVLNSLHCNLKFTVEVGTVSLPFLDVCVKIDNRAFETSVYRKKTHTGVFLNFSTVCPTQWKRGLILCLINRAKCICSSLTLFNEEVSCLRNMFIRNCYPVRFFDGALERFLNPRIAVLDDEDGTTATTRYSILRVPYYGSESMKFARRLSGIISRRFDVDIKIVYSTFKVKNYFQLKCRTPFHLLSNVIYKFDCVANTQTSYIGYTKRHMIARAAEHIVPALAKKSHVFAHIKNCDPCKRGKLNVSNFKVLRKCVDETDCKIAEAFAIKKDRPVINKQLFAQGTSLTLRVWK